MIEYLEKKQAMGERAHFSLQSHRDGVHHFREGMAAEIEGQLGSQVAKRSHYPQTGSGGESRPSGKAMQPQRLEPEANFL